jgi:hypothetical protein
VVRENLRAAGISEIHRAADELIVVTRVLSFVMPGLDPGIHVFLSVVPKNADGRVKPGHDEGERLF